jgi:hypothetical protein
MKAHMNAVSRMTNKEKSVMAQVIDAEIKHRMTEVEARHREIQAEAAQRALILAVFSVWKAYGMGEKRIKKYLAELDKWSEMALSDDTWDDEMCAALRKIGVTFNKRVK